MLTQVEVEAKADLSPRYLSNIERGKSVPSIDVLMQVADVLHMTPDEVLLGADDERRKNKTTIDQVADLMKYMSQEQQKEILKYILWLKEQEKIK